MKKAHLRRWLAGASLRHTPTYASVAANFAAFVKTGLDRLEPQKEPVLLAGVVLATRTQMTRRGKMAIVMLDDAAAQVEVTVFNELWDAERAKIKEDELLLVEGRVQKDDYSGGLRISADRLYTLGEARSRYARLLRLNLNGGSRVESAERLRALLAPYRGGVCPVRLAYRNDGAEAELTLPDTWRVRLDDDLLGALGDWLAPDNVKVVYS